MHVNSRFPLVRWVSRRPSSWPRSHLRLRPRTVRSFRFSSLGSIAKARRSSRSVLPARTAGPTCPPMGEWPFTSTIGSAATSGSLDTKGQMTRFTTDATGTQENRSPIFSPDGTRIVFASLRNGKWGLYLKGVSGGREELLYESGSRKMPMAWSPDGQYIVYWVASGAGQWVMPVKNPSAARPLHDRQNSHAQISPDGKWVAFNSQNQIYVKPFPSGEGLWKVSTDTAAPLRGGVATQRNCIS